MVSTNQWEKPNYPIKNMAREYEQKIKYRWILNIWKEAQIHNKKIASFPKIRYHQVCHVKNFNNTLHWWVWGKSHSQALLVGKYYHSETLNICQLFKCICSLKQYIYKIIL